MELWRLQQGDSPLIVNVPHAGTLLPEVVGSRLTRAARALPDTDWHVEKLYDFVPGEGATLMTATQSRYVVDLNRDPSGASLYPGADNTELCPTRTFADEPIYAADDAPSPDEVTQRAISHFLPYHQKLAAEVQRVRDRHGYAVLLDGHSIVSEAPRFFTGRLPDLNLGTASGASCAPELQAAAASVLAAASGFTHVVNGRFKGGWITRHYGRPGDNVHALQLEMAMRCYMDEAPLRRTPTLAGSAGSLPPEEAQFAPWGGPAALMPWDPARAGPLIAVLRRLVATLIAWRPLTGPLPRGAQSFPRGGPSGLTGPPRSLCSLPPEGAQSVHRGGPSGLTGPPRSLCSRPPEGAQSVPRGGPSGLT